LLSVTRDSLTKKTKIYQKDFNAEILSARLREEIFYHSSCSDSSSVTVSSAPPVAFNDISTNSGLAAGELFPVVHVKSKLLVVIIHALYSAPAFTVTFGNVATYSIIPPFVAEYGGKAAISLVAYCIVVAVVGEAEGRCRLSLICTGFDIRVSRSKGSSQ
jgi:hypothetical protein